MHDLDDDDVPSHPRAGGASAPGSSGRGDRLLAGAGILLAVASAAFPWYVFFNQDKFGIRVSPSEEQSGLDVSQHGEVAYQS